MTQGLYIHIPFCHSKCYYCDFLSFNKQQFEEQYVNKLIQELIILGQSCNKKISTVFIGGGTPTVLKANLLEKIHNVIRENFLLTEDYEWTIEANPGTITDDHLLFIENSKINRVSLGLQSTHNHLLKQIGRIHTFADWEKSIDSLIKIGIKHINCDLMFSLPNQTLKDWEQTLLTIVKYPIEHISAYSLILEEGTPLYEQQNQLNFPNDIQDREMYNMAKKILSDNNFKQYEISNWAKDGCECKHNIMYWEVKTPYLGAGLGASGYTLRKRYTNISDISQYLQSDTNFIEFEELITKKMHQEEFMFLGLRMTKGINKNDFYKLFKENIEDVFGEQINKWIIKKALVHKEDNLYLSDYGIDISNVVFASFLE